MRTAAPRFDLRRFLVSASLAAVPAGLLAAPGEISAHSDFPVLIQVTHNTVGDVFDPAIRLQEGDSIVFVSNGDVTGPAPGHREVYFYDIPSDTITRATTTIGGESFDASRETDDIGTGRALLFAFVSTGNLDPSVGNADHNPEIFLRFSDDGSFVQVTNTVAPVVNAEPHVSDSGKCLVFRSTGDLDDNNGSDVGNPGAGYSNLDASAEIFNVSFDDDDGSFTQRNKWVYTQVSNGPVGTVSSHPVVGGYIFSRQCRSTAYQSTADQIGNGSSGSHIYNYTRTTAFTEQLSPPGVGMNRNPSISSASNFARGPFVVYESNEDPIGNGSSVFEIFRWRLFKNELWQYTFAEADSTHPVVSDGGGRVALQSKGELLSPRARIRTGEPPPFNADANSEVFLMIKKKRVTQITQTENCENTSVSMRDLGDAVAFRSTCDLIPGRNPNHVPQVFYYVQVKGDDPLFTAAGCQVANDCCNVANGCFVHLYGRKTEPDRVGIRPDYTN